MQLYILTIQNANCQLFPQVIIAVSCSSAVHLLTEKWNTEILKWEILIRSIDTQDIT